MLKLIKSPDSTRNHKRKRYQCWMKYRKYYKKRKSMLKWSKKLVRQVSAFKSDKLGTQQSFIHRRNSHIPDVLSTQIIWMSFILQWKLPLFFSSFFFSFPANHNSTTDNNSTTDTAPWGVRQPWQGITLPYP